MAPKITPPPERMSQDMWPHGEPDTFRRLQDQSISEEMLMAASIKTVWLYSDNINAAADYDRVVLSVQIAEQLFNRTVTALAGCRIETHLSAEQARELARELVAAAEAAESFNAT